MSIVGVCESCGAFVLDTQGRRSAHAPVDPAKFIGGGEFDVLVKHSGYKSDPRYGHGGTWSPPRLVHIDCPEAE